MVSVYDKFSIKKTHMYFPMKYYRNYLHFITFFSNPDELDLLMKFKPIFSD